MFTLSNHSEIKMIGYEISDTTRWGRLPVYRRDISLADVQNFLPMFSRQPFANDNYENDFLDVISREPFGSDEGRYPIATVSKKYTLVQHRGVTDELLDAIQAAGLNTENMSARVTMSEYGARMSLDIMLPDFTYDPGDGYPLSLRLRLRNSVDGMSSFGVSISWFRLVCKNGMTRLTHEDAYSAVHIGDIEPNELRNFLLTRIPANIKQLELFRSWIDSPVDQVKLESWAEAEVRSRWGHTAAARVLNICRTGYDGRVEIKRGEGEGPVAALQVSSDIKVPGSGAPVANVYHAYQALTWISERRRRIEDQDGWGAQALDMTRQLLLCA